MSQKKWISVKDKLPEEGQLIKGRNKDLSEWEEKWDSQEPLGNMIEWRPITEDS